MTAPTGRRWGGLTAVAAVALTCGLIGIDPPLAKTSLGSQEPRADLAIGSTVHHLGLIGDRDAWQVRFPVRNIGARRLVLNEIDSECGCGDRMLRTMVVDPGEIVNLIVRLHPRSASEAVEKTVCFTTNDPRHPRLDLTVSAMVAASPPEGSSVGPAPFR